MSGPKQEPTKITLARVVCIDMTPPYEPTDMETTLDCLINCLSFMRNLESSIHASYLGIVSMNETVNVIFNIQDWRNKMETIESTLLNLKKSDDFMDLPDSQRKVEINWRKMLHIITREFQSSMNSIIQSEKSSTTFLLEIVVFTTKAIDQRANNILKSVRNFEKSSLIDKIQFYQLLPSSKRNGKKTKDSETELDPFGDLRTTVEFFKIKNDSLNLRNVFLSWNQQPIYSVEHIQLLLNEQGALKFRFDLRLKYLSPVESNFSLFYNLTNLGQSNRSWIGSPSQAPNIDKITLRLITVKKVLVSGICSSLFYGQPVELIPTTARKYNWSEIEENAVLIQKFCSDLRENGYCLIVKLQTVLGKDMTPEKHPNSMFCLKPEHDCFTAFGILTNEFCLSNAADKNLFDKELKLSAEKIRKYDAEMSMITSDTFYDPYEHYSNIDSFLQIKKHVKMRTPLKRKLSRTTKKPKY